MKIIQPPPKKLAPPPKQDPPPPLKIKNIAAPPLNENFPKTSPPPDF